MFTNINKSQGVTQFQTVAQNKFSQETETSSECVSTFTLKTTQTITPSKDEFISINRRRVYSYNEKG